MRRITKSQVITELRAIVAAKGADYVDPNSKNYSCKYGTKNRPSCIVGHVFNAHGLLGKKCVKSDDDAVVSLADPYNTSSAAVAVRAAFTPAALDSLQAAQRAQDWGKTWGEAFEAARA